MVTLHGKKHDRVLHARKYDVVASRLSQMCYFSRWMQGNKYKTEMKCPLGATMCKKMCPLGCFYSRQNINTLQIAPVFTPTECRGAFLCFAHGHVPDNIPKEEKIIIINDSNIL